MEFARRRRSNGATRRRLSLNNGRASPAGARAARDLVWRTVGEPLGRAFDCAELEPGFFERGDGLGEPLVCQFDRMTLQLDVSAELVAAAVSERLAAGEFALGSLQLP